MNKIVKGIAITIGVFSFGGIFTKLPASAETIVDYGWIQNKDGSWSYSNDGKTLVKSAWLNDHGIWYYFDANCKIGKGWIKDSSENWYYLNDNGSMKTGWLNDHGKWYYLNSNGTMAKNTTIGGYNIGPDGAWIQ